MRRPNGTGTIVKLGGKRRKKYAARISCGKTISNSGNVVTKYKYLGYFSTAKEAQETLDRYNGAENAVEKVKMTSKKDNPTFDTVYKETIAYLEGRPRGLSASSKRSLNASFNNLDGLHAIKFKNIDYDLLQKEITKNSHLSRSSMNNIKNLLRKMYTLALKKKYVEDDLSSLCDYDFTKSKEEKHKPFTMEERQKILEQPQTSDRDMVLILLYTGMRVQELLILETTNINLEKHYFTTGVKTEAGKNRIIPIHDKIYPIIQAHYNPNNFYFWDLQNSQRIYQTIRWRFDRYMKEIGMNHIPHDTRHSTATYMHNAGIDNYYIKLILGHRIDDLTQRVYIHTTPEMLLDEINKI